MSLQAIPEFDASAFFKRAEDARKSAGEQSEEYIGGIEDDPIARRKTQKRQVATLRREQHVADVLKSLPSPGESIVLFMTGKYHGIDLLGAMLEIAGERCEDLTIATLGTNQANTTRLAEFVAEGKVRGRGLTFVCSEMFSEKNKEGYQFLCDSLTPLGAQVASTRNHCKLFLLRFKSGRRIVGHGSLNLRRCNSFEQVAIDADAKLYRVARRFVLDQIKGAIKP